MNKLYLSLSKKACFKRTAFSSSKLFSRFTWMALLLSLPGSVFSITTTWNGTGNWDVATNWSHGIPAAADDAIINSGSVTVPTDYSAVAKSVKINNTAILMVAGTGILTVAGHTGDAVEIFSGGTLTIALNGIMNISNMSGGVGLFNKSNLVTNNGTLKINQVAQVGLFCSGGTFTNYGTVEIDNTGSNGLQLTSSTFNNEPGGMVKIGLLGTAISGSGILYPPGSTFNNLGILEIGSGTNSLTANGIASEGPFFNTGGTIKINNTSKDGISNKAAFSNSGTIEIGKTGPIGGRGIDVNATFTNSGTVEVNNTATFGINIEAGSIGNSSTIRIGNTQQIGTIGLNIIGSTTFTNTTTGKLYIDLCGNNGIRNLGVLENSGQIDIGSFANITGTGIIQEGSLANNSDATIAVDRVSMHGIQIKAFFTNNGILKIGNITSIGEIGIFCETGSFINGGIVEVNNNNTGPVTDKSGLFVANGQSATNNGTMRFGNMGPLQLRAIRVNGGGSFTNNSLLNIDNVIGYAILSDGTFSNSSTINIGGTTAIGSYGIWNKNPSNFTSTGMINIDRTGSDAILMEGGSFSNGGNINIGKNGGNVLGKGIHCTFAGFINSGGGIIDLENITGLAIDIGSVTFENTGVIHLRATETIDIKNHGFLTNGGTLNINTGATLTVNTGATLTNNATINMNGTFTLNGKLQGNNGSVVGSFTNNGTLAPGNSVGTLNVTGDWTNSGTLEIEIAGIASFDILNVTGTANLGGTLTIIWSNFTPTAGQSFPFLTANAFNGMFNTENVPPVNGIQFMVEISGTTLSLKAENALPVELVSFNGRVQNGQVLLDWLTASELDNEGFYLERASNPDAVSLKWETIGFVPGHGTSLEQHRYSFTDTAPLSGKNYYRLRQRDFDGKEDFSKVIQVEVDRATGQWGIFPNPVSAGRPLTIQSPSNTGTFEVKLFDSLGRPVFYLPAAQGPAITIEPGGLVRGAYWLRLQTAQDQFWEKVLVD